VYINAYIGIYESDWKLVVRLRSTIMFLSDGILYVLTIRSTTWDEPGNIPKTTTTTTTKRLRSVGVIVWTRRRRRPCAHCSAADRSQKSNIISPGPDNVIYFNIFKKKILNWLFIYLFLTFWIIWTRRFICEFKGVRRERACVRRRILLCRSPLADHWKCK